MSSTEGKVPTEDQLPQLAAGQARRSGPDRPGQPVEDQPGHRVVDERVGDQLPATVTSARASRAATRSRPERAARPAS